MIKYFILFVLLFTFLIANSQRLTLTDLTNLCNKKTWEDINQNLNTKGWEYYDSQKGSSYKYSTITWAYNKDRYSDKAEGWFYLFTYEDIPNQVRYVIFSKDSYTIIQNNLSAFGFKLSNSEIQDNQVVSNYSNQGFTLKISTEKRERSGSESSITTYSITLIKKSGIYDLDNGAKKKFYEDGYSIKSEYNLKNGILHGYFKSYYLNGNIEHEGNFVNGKRNGLLKKYYESGSISSEINIKNDLINGLIKKYYENGQIEMTGYYLNGKKNGEFKEYDENGKLTSTYKMLNDELNGTLITYINDEFNENETHKSSYINDNFSMTIETTNYVNGIREGKYSSCSYGKLYYLKDSLLTEYSGVYKNDIEDGIWNLFAKRNGKKELISFTTYKNGIREGSFKSVQSDSLIFGNYSNAKLDGNYIVYIDNLKPSFDGIIRTDSTLLSLKCKGNYSAGVRTGVWSFYSYGIKISEGQYLNGFKMGEWKYYYSNNFDEKGNSLNYCGKLYLIENYEYGKLSGVSTRYSYIKEEERLCDTLLNGSIWQNNVNQFDTCIINYWIKIFESSFYKDDLLHGNYILKDSIGTIRLQGNYINGEKNGTWIESYIEEDTNDKKIIIYVKGSYVNDKREGTWQLYEKNDFIFKEINYVSGKLHGNRIWFNKNKLPREIETFENDKLKVLLIYDSLGLVIVRKYEILKETNTYLKVLKNDYNIDKIESIEYYFKKDDIEFNYNLFDFLFGFKSGEFSNKEDCCKDCYPDGNYTLTDNKNNLLKKGNLLKNSKIGYWLFNFMSQNVQIQIEYKNNVAGIEKYLILNSNELFSGTFIYNDLEKNIKEVRKVKDGFRNGKTIYIDIATDKIIKKEKYENGIIKL